MSQDYKQLLHLLTPYPFYQDTVYKMLNNEDNEFKSNLYQIIQAEMRAPCSQEYFNKYSKNVTANTFLQVYNCLATQGYGIFMTPTLLLIIYKIYNYSNIELPNKVKEEYLRIQFCLSLSNLLNITEIWNFIFGIRKITLNADFMDPTSDSVLSHFIAICKESSINMQSICDEITLWGIDDIMNYPVNVFQNSLSSSDLKQFSEYLIKCDNSIDIRTLFIERAITDRYLYFEKSLYSDNYLVLSQDNDAIMKTIEKLTTNSIINMNLLFAYYPFYYSYFLADIYLLKKLSIEEINQNIASLNASSFTCGVEACIDAIHIENAMLTSVNQDSLKKNKEDIVINTILQNMPETTPLNILFYMILGYANKESNLINDQVKQHVYSGPVSPVYRRPTNELRRQEQLRRQEEEQKQEQLRRQEEEQKQLRRRQERERRRQEQQQKILLLQKTFNPLISSLQPESWQALKNISKVLCEHDIDPYNCIVQQQLKRVVTATNCITCSTLLHCAYHIYKCRQAYNDYCQNNISKQSFYKACSECLKRFLFLYTNSYDNDILRCINTIENTLSAKRLQLKSDYLEKYMNIESIGGEIYVIRDNDNLYNLLFGDNELTCINMDSLDGNTGLLQIIEDTLLN